MKQRRNIRPFLVSCFQIGIFWTSFKMFRLFCAYFMLSAIAGSSSFSFQDPKNSQKIKEELAKDDMNGHYIIMVIDIKNNFLTIADPMGRSLEKIEGFADHMIKRFAAVYLAFILIIKFVYWYQYSCAFQVLHQFQLWQGSQKTFQWSKPIETVVMKTSEWSFILLYSNILLFYNYRAIH